jgi:hypothetical protein
MIAPMASLQAEDRKKWKNTISKGKLNYNCQKEFGPGCGITFQRKPCHEAITETKIQSMVV